MAFCSLLIPYPLFFFLGDSLLSQLLFLVCTMCALFNRLLAQALAKCCLNILAIGKPAVFQIFSPCHGKHRNGCKGNYRQ